MNLKQTLMELGNKLVTERRFDSAILGKAKGNNETSTAPIATFTEWLNQTPDAIEILEEMGIEWPTIPQQRLRQTEKSEQ